MLQAAFWLDDQIAMQIEELWTTMSMNHYFPGLQKKRNRGSSGSDNLKQLHNWTTS